MGLQPPLNVREAVLDRQLFAFADAIGMEAQQVREEYILTSCQERH